MTNATTALRYLRWASFLEGLTLILLVCLAVPLKRMAGMPEFVTVMGPIHGLAFVAYIAMVARSSAASLLSAGETMQLMAAAFIPFGAFLVAAKLKRKAATLALAQSGAMFPAR
ncbi:MAG: DUF3817 domain-containing protein [Rhodoferax sp.]|uniref:DUF3817 domain-containing protein n=1 Tax=Rhodoferax sp. TaxID=50421 RepID=UPI002716FBBD|nr:DUF3817 domain-containing protein [Rhodoferax sp.]MDO8449724.1 DUF3817 domain-containing protein [Rhodoferax sp.]